MGRISRNGVIEYWGFNGKFIEVGQTENLDVEPNFLFDVELRPELQYLVLRNIKWCRNV